MTRLHLVRHGRAAAGWDTDPDPGLDDIGRRQAAEATATLAALAPCALVSSPLRRCQETAAPLAAQWASTVAIEPRVAEIPSPEGVPMGERVDWLRAAMHGTWADLGARYTTYRDGIIATLAELPTDTVVFSHFVAINAVIGAALGDDRLVIRSLDNCSITVVEMMPGGGVSLVTGGHEADTLIR